MYITSANGQCRFFDWAIAESDNNVDEGDNPTTTTLNDNASENVCDRMACVESKMAMKMEIEGLKRDRMAMVVVIFVLLFVLLVKG